jgi:hypothetical protein
MTDDKDARIAALEANQNRAFDSLSFLGVPKHRARSVSNGIEVLATRFRKADLAQSSTIAALEMELEAAKRDAEDCDLFLVCVEEAIKELRAVLRRTADRKEQP